MFIVDWLVSLKDFLGGLVQGVVDWLVGLLRGGWNWLVGQVPTFEFPAVVDQAIGGLHTIMGYVGKMDSWLPVGLIVPVMLIITGAYAVALAIRIARIVASFATLGGGS